MSRFLVVMAAPAVRNSDKLQYYIGRSYIATFYCFACLYSLFCHYLLLLIAVNQHDLSFHYDFRVAKSKKGLVSVSYDPTRTITINCLFPVCKTTITNTYSLPAVLLAKKTGNIFLFSLISKRFFLKDCKR